MFARATSCILEHLMDFTDVIFIVLLVIVVLDLIDRDSGGGTPRRVKA